MENKSRKKVLCPITKKNGKTFWMRIGSAFENRDGSWNVHLDAYPVNNKLQIRELDERDRQPGNGAVVEANGFTGSGGSGDALPF